jgi:hypothetical protein
VDKQALFDEFPKRFYANVNLDAEDAKDIVITDWGVG